MILNQPISSKYLKVILSFIALILSFQVFAVEIQCDTHNCPDGKCNYSDFKLRLNDYREICGNRFDSGTQLNCKLAPDSGIKDAYYYALIKFSNQNKFEKTFFSYRSDSFKIPNDCSGQCEMCFSAYGQHFPGQ